MTAFYTVLNGSTAHTDGYFEVSGNVTALFVAGFEFVAIDSGVCGSPSEPFTRAYVYNVAESVFDNAVTRIFVAADGSPGLGGSPGSPALGGIAKPNGEYVTLAGGSYDVKHADGTSEIISPASALTLSGTASGGKFALPGRAYLNYGSVIDTDLLLLLENFAGPEAPGANEGQLWYDNHPSANKVLKIYDGTDWIPVSGAQSVYWRDPARIVVQTSFANVAAAEAWVNANPQPQGIGTPLVDGDRILFTNISTVSSGSPGSPVVDNSNVYTLVQVNPTYPDGSPIEGPVPGSPDGSPAGSPIEGPVTPIYELLVDQNRFPPEPLRGDAVYIIEGDEPHTIYFFDENDQWRQFSGGAGGGVSLTYEAQLSVGNPTFTLTNPYIVTSDGSGLLVFVNGVKQVPNESYIEVDATTVEFIGSPIAAGAGKIVEFYPIAPTTDNAVGVREIHDATTGTQFVTDGSPATFTFDTISYVPGTESLIVYLNGQKAVRGRDYEENTNNSINWTGVAVNTQGSPADRIELYSYVPITAGTKLGDIVDVDSSVSYGSSPSPQVGDALIWDGTRWTYGSASGGKVFDEINISGSPPEVVALTNVTAQAKTSTTAYVQVFVNGTLQKEGDGSPGTGNFHVTGSQELTFKAGAVTAGDEVIVYEL